MNLLKCHIENFGKFSNFDYEFIDGLNVINQPNGYGKTTFASFIKAMFYGLESTAKRTTALTDRKTYYPWQGGMYGGNIEFETKGKRYRIERFFGLKEQEDTFKISFIFISIFWPGTYVLLSYASLLILNISSPIFSV